MASLRGKVKKERNMESVSNFIIHNLNPLKPLGKLLFRKFLGDFIQTEVSLIPLLIFKT